MTCGDCGKTLIERTVATKTKKVDGDVIVLAQRQALVCDEHGVVAWDPTHPVSYPVPYIPYVPVRPLPVPYWNPMTVQPWMPNTSIPRPYITCGGQLSANQCGGVINGNSTRALATVA